MTILALETLQKMVNPGIRRILYWAYNINTMNDHHSFLSRGTWWDNTVNSLS